jgi:hypothetical protein
MYQAGFKLPLVLNLRKDAESAKGTFRVNIRLPCHFTPMSGSPSQTNGLVTKSVALSLWWEQAQEIYPYS